MKISHVKSLWALYLANAREFLRDRITLFLVLLLPVALAVFFGLIFGGGDAFTLQVGVVDEDRGAVGAQILSGLEGQAMLNVETLPAYFKPLAAFLPLTYLSDALRQIMVGASPAYPLWVDFAALGGWLLVLLALTIKFWRWESR